MGSKSFLSLNGFVDMFPQTNKSDDAYRVVSPHVESIVALHRTDM